MKRLLKHPVTWSILLFFAVLWIDLGFIEACKMTGLTFIILIFLTSFVPFPR